MTYIDIDFLESNKLLIEDKTRIENVLANAKVATKIESKGVTVEITFTNKNKLDTSAVTYIILLERITSVQLEELLTHKRAIENEKGRNKSNNSSSRIRPRQRSN